MPKRTIIEVVCKFEILWARVIAVVESAAVNQRPNLAKPDRRFIVVYRFVSIHRCTQSELKHLARIEMGLCPDLIGLGVNCKGLNSPQSGRVTARLALSSRICWVKGFDRLLECLPVIR